MGRAAVMGRAATKPAAAVIGAALLSACASEPLSRDEVEGPEALVIPPDLLGEQATAEAADTAAEAADSGGGLPVAVEQTVPSRLVDADDGPRLELDMRLNEAWRATGAALDRLGFTVQAREPEGRYYAIRYQPQADEEIEQPGFFARWFGGAERIDTSPQRYRIQLERGDGGVVTVQVDEADGEPAPAQLAQRLLALLDPQLY